MASQDESALVDLISELVPGASTIAMLVNPKNRFSEIAVRNVGEAALLKGVGVSIEKASTEVEIDGAFASIARGQVDALIVGGDPFFAARQRVISALALRHAIPAIYETPGRSGELIVYAVDENVELHQAGTYVGRIIKGMRPADMPVQQPTAYKLAVNLKTARALGLTVPQSILVRADEVIE
jgi:putative tryptophan/tyrosine transport system substrate-binding protein